MIFRFIYLILEYLQISTKNELEREGTPVVTPHYFGFQLQFLFCFVFPFESGFYVIFFSGGFPFCLPFNGSPPLQPVICSAFSNVYLGEMMMQRIVCGHFQSWQPHFGEKIENKQKMQGYFWFAKFFHSVL